MTQKKILPKRDILDQIVRLLALQEKALSKARIHSALRIEKLLNAKIGKLNQKSMTTQDRERLLQAWAKTKSVITEIGQMCHNFFCEEKEENYNQVGEKIKKKRFYQNYSLKA